VIVLILLLFLVISMVFPTNEKIKSERTSRIRRTRTIRP